MLDYKEQYKMVKEEYYQVRKQGDFEGHDEVLKTLRKEANKLYALYLRSKENEAGK